MGDSKRVRIVSFQDGDFERVKPWFEARWPKAPDPELLPKTGYLAIDESGEAIACAFVYISNSKMAWIEWLATSPNAGMKGLASLVGIILHILKLLKESGHAKTAMLFLADKRLMGYLEKKTGLIPAEEATLCAWNI